MTSNRPILIQGGPYLLDPNGRLIELQAGHG